MMFSMMDRGGWLRGITRRMSQSLASNAVRPVALSGMAVFVWALALVSASPAHAQTWSVWSPEPVMTQGRMTGSSAPGLGFLGDDVTIAADGTGLASVEVYDAAGRLLGFAVALLRDQPGNGTSLATALRVVMNPQTGTGPSFCSLAGNELRCNLIVPPSQTNAQATVVVRVLGGLDRMTIRNGGGTLASFVGIGQGAVRLRYQATFPGAGPI